ncbi:hypothetical protein AB6A40_009644 [Gnathostoma spinigerum]|uniref:Uncharacterized protein n=1 Tax=Gnathostoma spinigerum TaxID=75299 RepID=A0ABD6F1X3_9BILA
MGAKSLQVASHLFPISKAVSSNGENLIRLLGCPSGCILKEESTGVRFTICDTVSRLSTDLKLSSTNLSVLTPQDVGRLGGKSSKKYASKKPIEDRLPSRSSSISDMPAVDIVDLSAQLHKHERLVDLRQRHTPRLLPAIHLQQHYVSACRTSITTRLTISLARNPLLPTVLSSISFFPDLRHPDFISNRPYKSVHRRISACFARAIVLIMDPPHLKLGSLDPVIATVRLYGTTATAQLELESYEDDTDSNKLTALHNRSNDTLVKSVKVCDSVGDDDDDDEVEPSSSATIHLDEAEVRKNSKSFDMDNDIEPSGWTTVRLQRITQKKPSEEDNFNSTTFFVSKLKATSSVTSDNEDSDVSTSVTLASPLPSSSRIKFSKSNSENFCKSSATESYFCSYVFFLIVSCIVSFI